MITDERKKGIEEFNECEAYFFIDMIGSILWRTRHDASHGRIEVTPAMEQELNDIYEEQVFCVQQLGKFGVDPESAKNRPNGDYWKWYDHWDNWKKAMSDEEWNMLNKKMENKEDYSEMLPKQKWNEKN